MDHTSNRPGLGVLAITFLFLAVSHSVQAQGNPELLWADVQAGRSGNETNFKPTLLSYPATGPKVNGAAVLICPGGGYFDLASDHEGIDVAKRFNTYGVSAFVVKYRRAPGFMYPIPFDDARRAMRMIRARAKQLNIDTSRIGVMGFSAGGHLASTLTVHFDTGDKSAQDSIDRLSCRPAFSVLIYPVISMKANITHAGSRSSLLGSNPDTNLVNFLSNDLQVTQSTPPSFLVHTKDDNVVKFQNSQLFYDACVKNKVVAKFQQFERGPHGFGMANGINGAPNLPELAVWPDTCAKWLETNGFFSASTSTISRSARSGSKHSKNSLVHGRMVAGSGKSELVPHRDFSGRALKAILLKH